ncbi:MAG: hypothetical protein LBP72_08055 [Dysgonamonadaceae bacterium]|jgi:hypothetical protein|nr:hypothetical protein [Dysgonamonadaceae bacterium]
MAICEFLIKQAIEFDCNDQVIAGIEQNGVIINRQDINFAGVVFNATRKNVIETFPLKVGKKGYAIYVPTPTPFNNTTTTMEKGTNRNTFTNDVGFIILNHDPDVCANIIDGLANGEFVIVYENKFKNLNKTATGGDSAFQIAGYYQGLRAETLENNRYSDETEGGWSVLLRETRSPKSGLFLYDTSYAVTKTLFASLLNIVPEPGA